MRMSTQTHALLLFEERYDTTHYVTWVLRVLNSARRGSHLKLPVCNIGTWIMHACTAVLDLHWFVVAYIGGRVRSCCLVPSRNAMGPFPIVRFLLKEAHPCYVYGKAAQGRPPAPTQKPKGESRSARRSPQHSDVPSLLKRRSQRLSQRSLLMETQGQCWLGAHNS